MSKKLKIIFGFLGGLLVVIGAIFIYKFIRIKTAKIEVVLVDNLKAEFNSKVKVSDYIKSINGKIIDNKQIDTTELGNKEIEFSFINDDNIKVKYSYNIDIVDTVKPLIWLNNTYNVQKGNDINLEKSILCGDNYDNSPKCYIEGAYDLNTVGAYELVYKAIDNSGNIEEKPFVLNVYEPIASSDVTLEEPDITSFTEVAQNYKTKNNKIGLDVSKWQGDIDFKKLKEAGVEFLMLKIGSRSENKFVIDKKFKHNIKLANKYKIPVGIYFYSYANSSKQAQKEAEWVLKQIKKYKVELPIAFDWEEWRDFNNYNLSFFGLTSMAETFMKTIEEAGYTGMLYSSKSYLEKIWLDTKYDIWLAHYTDKTDYDKAFKMWQICNNGVIEGIDGTVDIDILY